MFEKTKKKTEEKVRAYNVHGKKGLIIGAAVLIVVVFLGGVFLLVPRKTEEKGVPVSCGDLKLNNDSAKGTLPFTASLTAAISGDYDANGQICELLFDKHPSGKFKPVNGECKFDALKVLVAGSYNIGYKVTGANGQSCTKNMNVAVGPKVEPSKDQEKEGYKIAVPQ